MMLMFGYVLPVFDHGWEVRQVKVVIGGRGCRGCPRARPERTRRVSLVLRDLGAGRPILDVHSSQIFPVGFHTL